MEKVVKTFVSEIRSVNEKDFTLEAVISDETVDRYGEVIKVDAWKKRLNRYKGNPVLLTSHKYDKLTNQIGEAHKVGIVDGKLVAKFKYYVNEGNSEADWGWKLASKFGRAAYSVGFLPYTYDEKDYDDEVKMGKKPCREYTDVELLEVSQVLIPANPSAMMKSFEEEEDIELKGYLDFVRKGFEEEGIKEDIAEEIIAEAVVEEIEDVKNIEETIIVEEEEPEEIENKDVKEEEDMGEVLSAINELKETIEKKFEMLDSFIKDYNDFFVKNEDALEDEDLKSVEKEIEDENYIKKLLEETNDILTKTISVQSK